MVDARTDKHIQKTKSTKLKKSGTTQASGKIIKLYHATSTENAKKIRKNGIKSHSWFADTKKHAQEYAELNKSWKKQGNQVILLFEVPEKEVKKRNLLIISDANVLNYNEFMLHNYKLKRLRPVKKNP